MKKWLTDLEIFIDKFIPFLIILLLAVIIIDLFYPETAEEYEMQIGIIDGFIVGVFLVDLSFKYNRVRSIPVFIKKYWLEIIAVFPFYLAFRLIERTMGFLEVSGLIKESQNIFHSSIEVEKEIGLVSKETKELGEIERIGARSRVIARIFRTIGRAPRLIVASHFYEAPKILKKEIKKLKKHKK